MPPHSSYRILVADDHPMIRAGLKAYLQAQAAHNFAVEEAGTQEELLRALAAQVYDLILLDFAMEAVDGLVLIRSILERDAEAKILVYSMHDEEVFAERALRAGAVGFIMKNEKPADLLEAIAAVRAGQKGLSRKMRHRLEAPRALLAKPSGPAAALSDRELHVFRLLGTGMGTREIAVKLNISPKTVSAHRERIKFKLDLRTAEDLLATAQRWVAEQ